MPKPKKGESKQDFLKRCTAELVDREGRKREQAYAICNRYWDEERGAARDALTLTAPVELVELKRDDGSGGEDDDGPGEFLITAYTGAVWDTWAGKLVLDVKGMHAKEKFPILREHARDRVGGHSKKAWKDESNFYIRGAFSGATRDGEEVEALAREGFPWQASVAVWPEKITVLESEKETAEVNGRTVKGPIEIWSKCLVGETSFVALGRDDNTAAIVLGGGEEALPRPVIERGGSDMAKKSMKELVGEIEDLLLGPDVEDVDAVMAELGYVPRRKEEDPEERRHDDDAEEALEAAREAGKREAEERIAGILKACKLGGRMELAPGMIKAGLSVEEAARKVLEANADRDRDDEIVSYVSGMSAGETNPLVDNARRRAEAAQDKRG